MPKTAVIDFFRAVDRYIHTIRYLKPSQIFYRVKSIIFRKTVLIAGDNSHRLLRSLSRNKFHDLRCKGTSCERFYSYIQKTATSELTTILRFMEDPLEFPISGEWDYDHWAPKARDPNLWWFHLQYFDWLRPLTTEQEQKICAEVLAKWIRTNRLGEKNCFRGSWHPYTISRRLPNFIYACYYLRKTGATNQDIQDKILDSIRMQFYFLLWNLEKEHLANHYLENLIVIVICCCLLEGKSLQSLRPKYIRILKNEIGRQILSDGLHYERSFYYQGEILERLLLLQSVHDTKWLGSVILRMQKALGQTAHPDGLNPLFGDGGFVGTKTETPGNRDSPKLETVDYHYVYRHPEQDDYFIFDTAPHGASFNGAHMHCDLLGFELSLSGKRIVSDGGGGIYKEGPERSQSRSSMEHAVITVDGMQESDPWKSFRMGRRGHPIHGNSKIDPTGKITISAMHDGFARKGLNHFRKVTIDPSERSFQIQDCLISRARKSDRGIFRVESFLPLFAGIEVERSGDLEYHLNMDSEAVAILTFSPPKGGGWHINFIEGCVYTGFGNGLTRSVIRFSGTVKASQPFGYTIRGIQNSKQ